MSNIIYLYHLEGKTKEKEEVCTGKFLTYTEAFEEFITMYPEFVGLIFLIVSKYKEKIEKNFIIRESLYDFTYLNSFISSNSLKEFLSGRRNTCRIE